MNHTEEQLKIMRRDESRPWHWCNDEELRVRISHAEERLTRTTDDGVRRNRIRYIEDVKGELARREEERRIERMAEEWEERVRYEAAYDASIGHDLDDEGFSFHDYS